MIFFYIGVFVNINMDYIVPNVKEFFTTEPFNLEWVGPSTLKGLRNYVDIADRDVLDNPNVTLGLQFVQVVLTRNDYSGMYFTHPMLNNMLVRYLTNITTEKDIEDSSKILERMMSQYPLFEYKTDMIICEDNYRDCVIEGGWKDTGLYHFYKAIDAFYLLNYYESIKVPPGANGRMVKMIKTMEYYYNWNSKHISRPPTTDFKVEYLKGDQYDFYPHINNPLFGKILLHLKTQFIPGFKYSFKDFAHLI